MRQQQVLKTVGIIIRISIRFEKNGPHVKKGFTHYRINIHDANTIREKRNTRQQHVSKHNLNNTKDVCALTQVRKSHSPRCAAKAGAKSGEAHPPTIKRSVTQESPKSKQKHTHVPPHNRTHTHPRTPMQSPHTHTHIRTPQYRNRNTI